MKVLAEKKFHVKYIDLTTAKTVEETIPEKEQYDLYKRQREGKISIISIHYVTEGMTQTSDPLLFRRLRKRLKERREERKKYESSASNPQITETRDIVDLVRNQFNFTCLICEEIAEKVSTNFPDRVTQTRIYEAVYKLSSQDRKAQDEAMVTLGKLGVLEQVIVEVEQGWENLKGEKSD